MAAARPRGAGTLDDLFGYLDSVESEMTKELVLPDLSQVEDLHEEVREVKSTISTLQQREEEMKRELEASIAERKQLIEKYEREKLELQSRSAKKLTSQKVKYEEILKRHQSLMDGLLKEKESLARECEMVSRRLQVAREEAARREKEIQDQASQEIAQQRELAIAQERSRQKKLTDQKIKEVKEMTVRGMEPELQNLMARQKREIEALKVEHEEALRTARANVQRQADEEQRRLVEQLQKERQSEFAGMEQRIQRQLERERELHKQEIDRLMGTLKTLETEKVEVSRTAKSESESLISEIRERWKAELNAERARAEKEAEQWEAKLHEAIERTKRETMATFAPRESEMRAEIEAKLKDKSEKKLKVVVQKLEADLNAQKKKILDEAVRRVNLAQIEARKAVAALENEKKTHESAFAILKGALNEEKVLNNRLESENDRLTSELEQQRQTRMKLQGAISQAEAEIARLKVEIQDRETAAQEANSAVVSDFNKRVEQARSELQQCQIYADSERKALEERHASELATVSAKVKSLIEGKEQTIQALKEQLNVAQTRLREVEQLIHQQKKAILGVKR
jgi:5-azacytidine-induced protein 1